MDPFDLSDRAALVTGGNGGIGFGIAEGLAAAGAAVMIAGRDQAKSNEAVKVLRATGRRAEAITADVADETSCRSMVAATVKRLGRLDILVNNAGIGIGKRPEELTLAILHFKQANPIYQTVFAIRNAQVLSQQSPLWTTIAADGRRRRSSPDRAMPESCDAERVTRCLGLNTKRYRGSALW